MQLGYSYRLRAVGIVFAVSELDNAGMGVPQRIFIELATERLCLRAPDERDIAPWFARATDRESAALAGDAVPESLAAGVEWLARARLQRAEGRAFKWAIHRRGDGDSIGSITLSFKPEDPQLAELGFVLARAFWGQGLGTEAAHSVLRFAFDALGVSEVRAEAAARNLASRRILAKLGFVLMESFVDPSDGEPCEFYRLTGASLRR